VVRLDKTQGGVSSGAANEAAAEQEIAEEVLRTSALSYQQELPGSDADAIEVLLALLRAVRVHRTAVTRQLESLDLAVGMTGARYTLLMTLYFSRDNLLAQNEISRELNVSRTNITNLIDGLERDGLVERMPSPADRRVSYAQLTQRGRDVCVKLMPAMAELMQDATRDFSADEKAQFRSFLYRVQRNIVATHPGHYSRGLGVDQEPQSLP
jgi:DNA-binding MarR family transcriptional regulator